MIARIIAELGPWTWMAFGLLLLAVEVLVPGVFMVWFGIAALITGTLSLALWSTDVWTWPVQTVVFLILSAVCVLAGRRWMAARATETDQPLLNQRTAQLVGRRATLEDAIVNGYGRVRIGDTLWRVKGPDLPVGTQVTVTSAEDDTLAVEPTGD